MSTYCYLACPETKSKLWVCDHGRRGVHANLKELYEFLEAHRGKPLIYVHEQTMMNETEDIHDWDNFKSKP